MNQLPRSALLWLLAALVLALLPHSTHLPWGFALLGVLVIGWRWQMHRGRLPYPGKVTKAIAVALACLGIAVAFRNQFSLESATAFFVTASLLKLLEMKARRDGYLVVFLSYFLLSVGFLFEQGLLQALYGIAVMWVITAALVSLQLLNSGQQSFSIASRYSVGMLAAALPLMLVFYLFFPRMSPLWSMTLQSNKAITGLSGEMSPGDIASLSRSDELAFRVTYDDGIKPEREDLYWRGLVLDRFDGRTWRFSKNDRSVEWFPKVYQPAPDNTEARFYEIIQEPTAQHWLFTLKHGSALERHIGLTSTGLLVSRRPVHQRKRYKGVTDPYNPVLTSLNQFQRRHNLALPSDSNPRARSWAAEQFAQAAGPGAFIQGVLRHFNQQDYYYTLNPLELGADDIDAFLFDTRQGFCAHYAGALVFMARSVGIPARVVAGYQGGEWNESEKYLTVRQFDAHAWTELWIDGQGWVRVDPTAAVAPERIEFGLEAALQEEQSFLQGNLLSPHRFRGISWLNSIRMELDTLNYLWHRWVLSYDRDRQKSVLGNLLNSTSYKDMLMWLAGGIVVLFLVMGVLLVWRRPAQTASPLLKQWLKLQQAAAPLNLQQSPGDTSRNWLKRLSDQVPELQSPLMAVADRMDKLLYLQPEIPESETTSLIKEMKRLTRQVQRQARRVAAQKN
ncbi:MAG: transglutaminase [Oceanospirillaceae bacterium]|nr:transglutaminase [Oceanospirillaceae bacterium]|tara:strand:+ start:674 stop:2701 length:2028 start_codon:yes stop_codon:yes gene_type:complete